MKTRGQKQHGFVYNFKKDQILGQSEKGKPILFKVVEDMKTNDHRSQIRVVKLEQQEKQKDGKVVYKEAEEILLPVKERTKLVEEVEVKQTKTNPKSKTSVTFFTFPQDTLQEIAKSVRQLPANKTQKKQVSSESEESSEEEPPQKFVMKKGTKKVIKAKNSTSDEDSEERPVKQVKKSDKKKNQKQQDDEDEDSESEELPPKPTKKTQRKTQQTKQNKKKEPEESEEDEEDEEQEQEQEIKNKKQQSKQQKSQQQQQQQQQQQTKNTRGRKTKNEEEEQEEEEAVEESQISQSSQSVDNKKKKKKSVSKKSKSQPAEPTKFVKGKYNPNYRTLIQVSQQFEGTTSTFTDYSSVVMNNKEVIRAAKIGNQKLLEDIFSKSNKISNLFQRWAPENDINALEIIFQRQDESMLLKLIKSFGKLKLGVTPRCALKEINTGYNDKYAYGVRTRRVALSRGGREGNNAFVYDLAQEDAFGHSQIERLMKIETDPKFFGLMIAQMGQENQYFELIAAAVRSGNWKTAGYLVQMAFDKGGFYGFNQVHVDVLNYTAASRIGQIKKPSATKKTLGQYLITPIHCACINPNHACLQKLLDISQEFNILDEIHRKPVHYAAVSQTNNCLRYLLENGVDAREGDRFKNTPLILAAQFGRTHNVSLLAANNINGKNKEGNAPIHLACQGGYVDTVKELIKHGALINQPGQNRMTPLIIASAYGHYDLVKYLIQEGAKVIHKDKFGRTSCAMAARNGNLNVLSYLLYNGAEYNLPDSSKNTPLHYAAAYGFPECIEELMKAGADQNLTNSWKLTPLSVALQKNHFGVVKTLLNYPTTDVNCKDDEGRTLISSSLSSFTADSFEYMKFLILEKNADVKIADLQEKTPLHYAVLLSRKQAKQYYQKWQEMPRVERKTIKDSYEKLIQELIKLLIDAGSDINIPDKNGTTPFMQALISQNFRMVEFLMSLQTPKVDGVDERDRNIVHKLIECKLFANSKGYTILESIIRSLDSSYIQQFDENGWSPLLFLISEYTKSSEQIHNQILNKKIKVLQNRLFEDEIAKLPKETQQIQEEEGVQQNNAQEEQHEDNGASDDDEDQEEGSEVDEEDEDIPIRKKTAFKHPRLVPFNQPTTSAKGLFGHANNGGFGSGFQQHQTLTFGQPQTGLFGNQNNLNQQQTIGFHQKTFYYNSKPIIISLNLEQLQELKNQTKNESLILQEQVLKLIKEFITLGANPDNVVIKRKKFRNNVQEENSLLLKEDPYIEEGEYTIAHFIFLKYHSVSFLQELQKIIPTLNMNQSSHKSEYPIHLFAQTCNPHSVINDRVGENSLAFLNYVLPQLDVRVNDKNNNTAVSILASRYYEGLEQFIEAILQNGGNIDNLNKQNEVPLHKWVKSNNIQIVELFLTKFKADPNFRDKYQRTALHHAINSSNSQADASFEMELLLINNGANTGLKDKLERTPLFYAFIKINQNNEFSEIDPFETVSSIMADKNCEVNCVDIHKRSPLHYAAMRGSVISARYMIKSGKAIVDEPDKFGNTPLGLSFICGHSNICTMLIDNKADVSRDAIVIDYVQLKEQEKLQRQERRLKGEEVETEDEDLTCEQNQQQQQNNNTGGLFGGARTWQTARPAFGGKGLFGNTNYNGYNQQNQLPPQPTKFSAGTYSYFKLAIKHGWQGVAYLLISDGFDLQRAIEDAMMEGQFKLVRTLLMKVKKDSDVQKTNKKQQNLFHIFAMKGNSCQEDVTMQIANELTKRGVDKKANDDQQNTPLHYACQSSFHKLQVYLIHQHCNVNAFNLEQNTPFTIKLQQNYKFILNALEFPIWTSYGADLNTRFKVNKKEYVLSPFLYVIQEFHCEDEILLTQFTEAGADVNEKTQKGDSSLILAIKINSLKLVNFIVNHKNFQKQSHIKDSFGRSPIHCVVQPLDFGSYENVEILNTLAQVFDINEVDKDGRTPLDYANDQDSGVMTEALKKKNGKEGKRPKQPRLPTSIISQAQWVEEEIDVEADAQQFLDQCGEQLDDTKQDINSVVDQYAVQAGKVEVLIDKEIGAYSLLMTKVDIGNGQYSENLFYKMQVLHEINRNVYILFTRWGRIGTPGQYQQTPFENSEEAIKEFTKIFYTKAGGNDWRKVKSGEEEFVKKPGKYQLMNVRKLKNYKTLMVPFDFSKKSPYPPCKLDNSIKRFIFQFSQVKLYQKDLEQFHVDLDFMPIERLDRKQLEVAKAILNELTDSVEELVELRKKGELDIKKISNISSEIADKSSRFYELIPQRESRTEPLPSLDSIEAINQKLLLIETLLNFEITSKILLGAHLNKQALNPLTYCFNALNVRVYTLPKEHPEFNLIQTYMNQSHEAKISNIFAVERRGEAERFENNKQYQRLLLWHGSKISNFMGILAQGLKVAPPWAFNTGAMFGKGIYFADMFQKSYGYTEDWSLHYNQYNNTFQAGSYGQSYWGRQQQQQVQDEQQDIQRYRYMLLCEVAVGKSQELYNSEYITDLPKQFQSVKGCGRQGPDYQQSIILSNGCKVPVGNIIEYPTPTKKDKNGNPLHYYLQHNEYIVYEETKVKIRYMVQLDTKSTIDEY